MLRKKRLKQKYKRDKYGKHRFAYLKMFGQKKSSFKNPFPKLSEEQLEKMTPEQVKLHNFCREHSVDKKGKMLLVDGNYMHVADFYPKKKKLEDTTRC